MDDSNIEEVTSPDISRPRYLFRRYDSASGSSGSNNSSISSNSVGSFQQSLIGKLDRSTQRRRTISANVNESKSHGGGSSNSAASRGKLTNGLKNAVVHDEQLNNEDSCVFCSSMVNERQYYLWESQYTKSSLCPRCTDDNDGMRYISFWGTPSYEMGSWRKRYRAGRSLDVDLSPLLEVLEKIDRIDTSMYGRNSSKNHHASSFEYQKSNTKSVSLQKVPETKESVEMSARRRRRMEHRKIIEHTTEKDDHRATSQYLKRLPDELDNVERSDGKGTEIISERRRRRFENQSVNDSSNDKSDQPDGNDFKYMKENCGDENNNNKTDNEVLVHELSQDMEHVDIIEPLQVLHTFEQDSSNQSEDCVTSDEVEAVQSENTLLIQRPTDLSSPEAILKYIKHRRKSNYEDFIAGLEPASTFQRRSSADKDLTVNFQQTRKNKKKENFTHGSNKVISKSNCTSDSDMTICPGETYRNIAVGTNTQEKETKFYRNNVKHEFNAEKNKECRKNKVTQNESDELKSRNNYKYGAGGYNQATELERSHQEPCELGIMPTSAPHVNHRRRPKKFTRKKKGVVSSSSSDEEQFERETFSDIKRRFENFCHGESFQSRQTSSSKPSTILSKGHFRSQYLKMSNQQQHFDNIENENDNSDDNCDNGGNISEDSYNHTVSVENSTTNESEIDDKCTENDKEPHNLNGAKLLSDNPKTCESTNICTASEIKTKDMQELDTVTKKRQIKMTNNNNFSAIQVKNTYQEISVQEESHRKDTKCPSVQDEERTKVRDNLLPTKKDYSLQALTKASVCTNNELSPIEDMGEHSKSMESRTNSESSTSTDDVLKNIEPGLFDSNLLGKNERENRALNAWARVKKYKQISDEAKDDNPNIKRIKKKLGSKPIYEVEDSDANEKNAMTMELNGSNDEEVELCWRTRGYNTDFYMSRRSVTGGEILDRYNRAMSNRRSMRSIGKAQSLDQSNAVDRIMTQSEPISRCESTIGTGTNISIHSEPLTRTSTRNKLPMEGNENEDRSKEGDASGGVNAAALKAALDRANICSKRMSQRLEFVLGSNDSCESSS